MKRYTLLLWVLFCALFTVSCSEKEPGTGENNEISLINPEDQNLSFEAAGGERNISFKSTQDWSISIDSNADWINVNPLTGNAGTAEITISVSQNPMADSRISSIAIKGSDAELQIKVSQDGQSGSTSFVEIPDTNFKKYLVENYDTDKDGEISVSEAETITEIYVRTNNIKSVTGIEAMPNLVRVELLGFNPETNEGDGILEKLDLTHNTKIKYLDTYCNQVTELDLSKNVDLEEMWCIGNKIKNLDITKCTKLVKVVARVNELESIDLSQNTKLKFIDFGFNQLSSIDFSHNTEATEIYCGENKISSLDFSNNKEILGIYSYNNKLSSINLSGCKKLVLLRVQENELKELDLHDCMSLQYLSCAGNQLKDLDFSQLLSLKNVDCANNQLEELDIRANQFMKSLMCENNRLTELNTQKNEILDVLNCSGNQLSELDLTLNAKLEGLYCGNNQLTTLDLTQNTLLAELDIQSNQFEEINISKNKLLIFFYAINNPNLKTIYVWSDFKPEAYPEFYKDASAEYVVLEDGDPEPEPDPIPDGTPDVSLLGGVQSDAYFFSARCNSHNASTARYSIFDKWDVDDMLARGSNYLEILERGYATELSTDEINLLNSMRGVNLTIEDFPYDPSMTLVCIMEIVSPEGKKIYKYGDTQGNEDYQIIAE